MDSRYRRIVIILGLFLAAYLLCGCSEEEMGDNGELIWRQPEQIEMYI